MAQANLLHPEQCFGNPTCFGRSSRQAPPQHLATPPEDPTLTCPFSHVQEVPPMAQPYLQQPQQPQPQQQQYGPETSFFRGGPWASKEEGFEQQLYTTARLGHAPALQHLGALENTTFLGGNFAFKNNMSIPPQMMSGSYNSDASYTNGALLYSGLSSLDFLNRGITHGIEEASWMSQPYSQMPYDGSADSSNPDTASSYSPKSYISESPGSKILPYTPKLKSEHVEWTSCSSKRFLVMKASSPDELAATTNNVERSYFSRLPQHGAATSVPSPAPAGVSHCFEGFSRMYDDTSSQQNSEFAYSQNSSPDPSQWHPNGPAKALSFSPNQFHDATPSNAPCLHSSTTTYQAHEETASRQVGARSDERTNALGSEDFQERVYKTRVMDSEARRKADDRILLDGKKEGLTYKEIRKKMYTKCAESTLRGRYRSLTKARQDRVRRPFWHKKDIELLQNFVQGELDRIDGHHHQQALTYDQRLTKVPWKKVATFIYTNGGSYHFGNSTCKRKWQELHPEA
ncbi:hypothetical protein ACEQ8H_002578 [Pleosporales sp. CAS-2024a]